MLRFEDLQNFVEIDVAIEDTADLPSFGDARVTIHISSSGFEGHNNLWVLGPALHSFSRALIALEQNRRGEAVLESVAPDELRLVLRSVNSRGHMIIEGFTGRGVLNENSRSWHSVHFGFEFDPSQLVRAVSVDWVKRSAEACA